ncbi:allene oxide synthase 3-like [Vicia villosa]|uniref:allene oxide synthase 3-like n=1 Tax=Vicia villosa TaxID=3911 RepID=UPI00273BA951|nr:allene oxide synthase 3-like [Vicia villosa]
MASSEPKQSSTTKNNDNHLPLKQIPGSYGLPFFGPIFDRHDYFYNQGRDKFFSTRIQKYNSTIFRTNMPPGPFISSNPRVIALLDAASFPILFDNKKVEKHNVFDGTFMPSTNFTGGYRVCAQLDTTEPNHALIKGFFLNQLLLRKDSFVPLFRSILSEAFNEIEEGLSGKSGKADFNTIFSVASFNFMFRLFCDNKDPSETKLGSQGPKMSDTWILFQLFPIETLKLPKIFNYLEDLLLRTLPFPACLTSSSYKKLYEAFSSSAVTLLNEAEKAGLKRSEACHQLIFIACFNSYGGFKNQFPTLFKLVGLSGQELHKELATEIRTVVKQEGGVTIQALEKMPLVKSVVYETMRIEPIVRYQYAKAREDLIVESHDAAFEVKKGEMLFGYQSFATKDPKIFDDAEVFVPKRFVGEGEKLLKYVLWSNGKETDEPSVDNKQCPGKNLVVLLCRLFLVEFFLRYDTFTFETKEAVVGVSITITSLTKASTI